MGDLISRKMAVDAIHEDADWLAAQGSDWQEERMERDKSILMSLPSAEPETPSNGSITSVKPENMHDRTMGDLIRRQEAIDAVEFGITYAKAIDVNTGESKELFKEGNDALKKAVGRLKELPSAQPEHEGYWINKGIFTNGLGISWHCWECSKCHSQKTSISNFCPDCGTKMKGVKHESD